MQTEVSAFHEQSDNSNDMPWNYSAVPVSPHPNNVFTQPLRSAQDLMLGHFQF